MSKKIGGAALLLAVAAVALLQSWQRWLDPIIDTGRDLYIPEQLARGAKLYRDIRYQYPPLTPYLLALMPGRSLAAYTILGIAQSAVIAVCLWLSLRRNALAAFAAVLMFVALSFCGASTWGANFIFPYTYAATLGMMFLTIALAAVLNGRVNLALVALYLASWCKLEYAIAAALIAVVLVITKRASLKQFAVLCVLYVPYVLYVPSHLPPLNNATAEHFFAVVSGIAHWRDYAVDIPLALLAIVAIFVLLGRAAVPAAGPAASSPPPERRRAAVLVALLIMIPLASHNFFRAWAVLQIVALVYGLVKERGSPLAIFAVFSLAASLRVLPMNLSPAWYGFVLIVPAYALIAYVLFVRWPSPVWLALIAMICARDLWEQHERWSAKMYPIVTARGTLYDANRERARALNEFHPTGTLVVFPEGITINYLTRTTTPLTFHTFTPVETADPKIEDQILGEIAAHPPDRIAIVARDVAEYGSRGFGLDYDQRLAAWIRANYVVERRWPVLLDLRRR